jgi:peptide/nickel transport system substrate-binding protein
MRANEFMNMWKKIASAMGSRERIVLATAAGVLVISAVLLANFLLGKFTREVPAFGGQLKEGIVGQPALVNPILAASDVDNDLVRLLFARIADVADKIESDPESDNRIWRLRLKEDARWHDGRKLTSDDVIFTVESAKTSLSRLEEVWSGVTPQRLSELEVRFVLDKPSAFFDDTLRDLFPIPKHIFADVPISNWHLSDYRLKPIGSGPYRFVRLENDAKGFISRYLLEANEAYIHGRPLIEEIALTLFADKETAIQEFKNGRIDSLSLASGDFRDAQIVRPHKEHLIVIRGYYAVFLNQNKHDALKESAVRQALVAAADPQRIAGGILPPAYGPTTDEQQPRSAEEAARLLDAAGWKPGEDAIRRKEIGRTVAHLAFTLFVPDVEVLKEAAERLKEQWSHIGVALEIAARPAAELMKETVKNRDYEMILFGNVVEESGDLTPFWHSAHRFHPGLNLSLNRDSALDELLDDYRERGGAERLAAIEERIADTAPAIFLMRPELRYVLSRDVNALIPEAGSYSWERWNDIHRWYIRTKRVGK